MHPLYYQASIKLALKIITLINLKTGEDLSENYTDHNGVSSIILGNVCVSVFVSCRRPCSRSNLAEISHNGCSPPGKHHRLCWGRLGQPPWVGLAPECFRRSAQLKRSSLEKSFYNNSWRSQIRSNPVLDLTQVARGQCKYKLRVKALVPRPIGPKLGRNVQLVGKGCEVGDRVHHVWGPRVG